MPAEAVEAANRALGTGDGWMLGTGCLQRGWETQNNQGSPGGGDWRVVPMAGGSSSASHIHPRSSQGKLQLLLVARGLREPGCRQRVLACLGGVPCTVPVLQLGGEQGLRSGSGEGELGGGSCPGSIRRVCGDTELVAKSWTWILQPISMAAIGSRPQRWCPAGPPEKVQPGNQ